MKICLLASGSKGNAVYIESGEDRILIDAGLAARELEHRLQGIGATAEEVHGILVTHEHGDHCRGLGPMARRHRLPVHLHHRTRQALPHLGRIDELHEFEAGQNLAFRGLQVHAFPLTHDAVAPVGFTIERLRGKSVLPRTWA